MSRPPSESGVDHSLALLREGYEFIGNRCRRYASQAFVTRLFMQAALCVRGGEAASLLYGDSRLTRRGAVPPTALKLLQGRNSVQTLDGPVHRHRKAMFLGLMAPDRRAALVRLAEEEWRRRLPFWQRAERVQLFPEVEEILCRAVCDWSGVPLPEDRLGTETRRFAAMIDGAGSVGPRNWRGLWARLAAESWIRDVIRDIRSGAVSLDEAAPARVVALHRESRGPLLDVQTAATELINILRPTVAVARYIVFAALALHEHPHWRDALTDADAAGLRRFTDEVRRYYPFFPFIAAQAREDFAWGDIDVPRGRRIILDIYGTNRDETAHADPDRFDPERFLDEAAPRIVPQGDGDFAASHRCPGEWLTAELTDMSVRMLVSGMTYDVPPQDLKIDLSRIPARPRSGFVMTNVRPARSNPPPAEA